MTIPFFVPLKIGLNFENLITNKKRCKMIILSSFYLRIIQKVAGSIDKVVSKRILIAEMLLDAEMQIFVFVGHLKQTPSRVGMQVKLWNPRLPMTSRIFAPNWKPFRTNFCHINRYAQNLQRCMAIAIFPKIHMMSAKGNKLMLSNSETSQFD